MVGLGKTVCQAFVPSMRATSTSVSTPLVTTAPVTATTPDAFTAMLPGFQESRFTQVALLGTSKVCPRQAPSAAASFTTARP